MNNCACKSDDRYDCWALRYHGHTGVSGMMVDLDGGPCECSCHEASDPEWECCPEENPNAFQRR
jgi:hypothetical protein